MSEYLLHNPFNGNNTPIVKVVKKQTFLKNAAKYAEFTYDTDNGADENDFYTLLVNSKGEGLLIRE